MEFKDRLSFFDNWIYEFLSNHQEVMPLRFAKWIANYYPDARIRKLYWQQLGIEMGIGTYANLGLKLVPNDNKICVHIGNHVSIAPDVTFVCYSCANNGQEINKVPYVLEKLTKKGDIIVEDEAWIGASVTILPGVKIGYCSVIGAGSVVIADTDPLSVYAGTPAIKIRDLRTGERIKSRSA